MKGSDVTLKQLLEALYAVSPAGRAYGYWLMTRNDRDQITARFPPEYGPNWSVMYGKPVKLRDGEDGIEFVPGEPPRPGVFLDVGDTIEYVHCTDPSCPAVREGYSHAHRGEVIRSADAGLTSRAAPIPDRTDNREST